MRRTSFVLLALAAGACMPAPRPTPPARVAAAAGGAPALDSATARRICARPDSVLAAGHATACEPRDQRPPIKVF